MTSSVDPKHSKVIVDLCETLDDSICVQHISFSVPIIVIFGPSDVLNPFDCTGGGNNQVKLAGDYIHVNYGLVKKQLN